MKITFYLVRHGESENNVRSILNSLPEIETYPLTQFGKEQITEVAKFLAAVNPDAIFSSPLRRTKETAEIISSAMGLKVEFDERLREAGWGEFNGKKAKSFLKNIQMNRDV